MGARSGRSQGAVVTVDVDEEVEVEDEEADGGMKALPKLEGEYWDDVEEARMTVVVGLVVCFRQRCMKARA